MLLCSFRFTGIEAEQVAAERSVAAGFLASACPESLHSCCTSGGREAEGVCILLTVFSLPADPLAISENKIHIPIKSYMYYYYFM